MSPTAPVPPPGPVNGHASHLNGARLLDRPPAADAGAVVTGHPDTADGPPPTLAAGQRPSWTAAELMTATFPEPRWAVPGIIAEGLNVLAGAPKVGKSWLALDLAVSIALGRTVLGRVRVESGPVLYLALEDTGRRLQARLSKVLAGAAAPEALTFVIDCPPLFAGGSEQIAAWLEAHPDARLVIIDVFAKLRGYAPPSLSAYEADYRAVGAVKNLADHYGVAVLLISHTRKMRSDDFLDDVSGTTGIAGAADAILVLKRARGEADGVLHVTGRDVDEAEYAMRFAADLGAWQLLDGPAVDLALPATRAAILGYLRQHGSATPKQIADGLGKEPDLIRKTARRMAEDRQLETDGHGRYFPPRPQLTLTDEDPLTGIA